MKTLVYYHKLYRKYPGLKVCDQDGNEYPYDLASGDELHVKLPITFNGELKIIEHVTDKSDPEEVWSEYRVVDNSKSQD